MHAEMSMGEDFVGWFGTLWLFLNFILLVSVGKEDTPPVGSMCNVTVKTVKLFFSVHEFLQQGLRL
jgi:hypothetical protein